MFSPLNNRDFLLFLTIQLERSVFFDDQRLIIRVRMTPNMELQLDIIEHLDGDHRLQI
jgi:hypothetical protein